MTIDELAANWSGDLIFAVRRDRLVSAAKSFGIGWFVPVVKRFSRVLAEVLLVSVFIQLIALVAPLFTQVTIDKVLVHRGLTTLEVLVIGLVVLRGRPPHPQINHQRSVLQVLHRFSRRAC